MSRNTMYVPRAVIDAENDVLRRRLAEAKELMKRAQLYLGFVKSDNVKTMADILSLSKDITNFCR